MEKKRVFFLFLMFSFFSELTHEIEKLNPDVKPVEKLSTWEFIS